LDQGKPLDGYGFQCHFIGGSVPDDFAETLGRFSDLGLEVALTELDVRVPANNRGLTNSTWLDIQYVVHMLASLVIHQRLGMLTMIERKTMPTWYSSAWTMISALE
jgi:endo-1,4-beta-xylanase